MIPLEIPPVLKGLTIVEEMMIQRISPHFKIISVKYMGKKFKGNMISFPKKVAKIYDILPHVPDDDDI